MLKPFFLFNFFFHYSLRRCFIFGNTVSIIFRLTSSLVYFVFFFDSFAQRKSVLVYVSGGISSESKWNCLKQQLSGVIVLIKIRIICPNERLFIRLHDFSFSFFGFNYSIMCVIEMLETKIKRRFAFRLGWNKTKQGKRKNGTEREEEKERERRNHLVYLNMKFLYITQAHHRYDTTLKMNINQMPFNRHVFGEATKENNNNNALRMNG